MKKHLIPLAISAALLSACSSTPEIVEPPMSAISSEYALERIWQVKQERFLDQDTESMQIAETPESLYIASSSGMVTALNKQQNGRWIDQIQWQSKLDEAITAGPTLDQDQLLLGTAKGRLKVLDAQGGQVLWVKQLSSEVLSAPVVAEGKILLRTVDGQFYALNRANGDVIWQVEHSMPDLSLRGAAAPVVLNNTVFVPWESGVVQAFSLDSGALLWESRIAVPSGRTDLERLVDIQSSLVIANGYLYVAGYHGKFAALDPESGNFIFVKELSSFRDFVMDDKAIYFVDDEDVLYAFDALNGVPLWKQTSMKNRWVGDLALSEDGLIVTDGWGYVHWFNKVQGIEFARVKHSDGYGDGNRVVRLKVDGERLYLYDDNGVMTQYKVHASNWKQFELQFNEIEPAQAMVDINQSNAQAQKPDLPWYQSIMNLWPF